MVQLATVVAQLATPSRRGGDWIGGIGALSCPGRWARRSEAARDAPHDPRALPRSILSSGARLYADDTVLSDAVIWAPAVCANATRGKDGGAPCCCRIK